MKLMANVTTSTTIRSTKNSVTVCLVLRLTRNGAASARERELPSASASVKLFASTAAAKLRKSSTPGVTRKFSVANGRMSPLPPVPRTAPTETASKLILKNKISGKNIDKNQYLLNLRLPESESKIINFERDGDKFFSVHSKIFETRLKAVKGLIFK